MVFALRCTGECRMYGCRSPRGSMMRFCGGALEIGPDPKTGQAALRLDAGLQRVESAASEIYRSPALLATSSSPVLSVLVLSWAHLEGEEGGENVPQALRENQDTFLLNFVGSSVRSQLAAKAGSAWC
eukprot:TRINITY_DN96973_c0_g1_i1.p1 TRINITY_DN96973_c0_g1~~TRINITY_DN96973_c0_g1_i1.p1  ORF type:complete len:148 (+),score=28.21 TRINITY_DN96973_c0_g1_i1:63-446(+)